MRGLVVRELFVLLVLQAVEVGVEIGRIGDQLGVGAAFQEPAIVQHMDGAGVADGRETVGDDNGGS